MAKATKRKKRTMSKAQKSALAKGRRALAMKRAKRKTVSRKPSVLSKPKRKVSAKRTVSKQKSGGATMPKKRKAVVRQARQFVKKSRAVQMLTDAGLAIVGGVTSGWLTSKVPIQDARIRSALPILSGIVVAGTLGQKNPIARKVAEGMVILGTVSVFKQLAPGVPMLAGERVIMLQPPKAENMGMKVKLGESASQRMGIPVRLGGKAVQTRRYKTAAFS